MVVQWQPSVGTGTTGGAASPHAPSLLLRSHWRRHTPSGAAPSRSPLCHGARPVQAAGVSRRGAGVASPVRGRTSLLGHVAILLGLVCDRLIPWPRRSARRFRRDLQQVGLAVARVPARAVAALRPTAARLHAAAASTRLGSGSFVRAGGLNGAFPATMAWHWAADREALELFRPAAEAVRKQLGPSYELVGASFVIADGSCAAGEAKFHLDFGPPDIPVQAAVTALMPLYPQRFPEAEGNLEYRPWNDGSEVAVHRNVAFSSVSARANTTISQHVFEHLHELSLQYHLSRQTGALATTVDRGKRGMQWILSVVVFNVVPTLLEVVLVSCWLAYALGPGFGLITAGTIGVYTVWTCSVASWRTKIRKTMNEADSAASSLMVDSLMNYETVKIFNAERYESQRYAGRLREYEAGLRQTATSLALLNFGQQVIFAGGMTTMLLLCARGVTMGTMTVGDLVMANAFLLQLSQPLNWLGTMYSETRRSLVDFQAMNDMLLDSQTQPLARAGALPLFPVGASGGPLSVAFDGVTFRYPTAAATTAPLLRGVSFHVPAGETLGIVGASGSGKSSVLRLLFRFYDCEAGGISVGGRDIRDIELDSLRRGIGLVPQDVVLFNATLYENVRYGDPAASAEEVRSAIRGAALDSVAAGLPNGLETVVGERGLKLSGGEKQRVAIARALLKRPPILLIDEGTASLDSKTEGDVLAELRAAAAQQTCTTIMIAHRLSTLRSAEQIIVLKDGVVTEAGSHAYLLDKNGEYADLWARQQSEPGQ